MTRIRWILLAVLVVPLAGCDDVAMGSPAVSDSTFVETMARLHAIDRDSVLDSAGRANARRQVLQEEGLTSDALVGAAKELADDPRRVRDVWMAIDKRTTNMTSDPRP